MKWTYGIKHKMAASGVLFLLCLLVLFSHYLDRQHTENVKNSISTLYEDRLVAEGHILKMTGAFYQIREALSADINENEKSSTLHDLLSSIRKESKAYQQTKFTSAEERKASTLFSILKELDALAVMQKHDLIHAADNALIILEDLSYIQLEESKQIMANAELLYASGKTSSQFVFAIIVIILFALQALVFASKTLFPRNLTKTPNLN